MSATLRITDFSENRILFPNPPPVINVPARQHPVTIHFSRRTASDYVTEAVKKASKIHARLPPGGILIFLTGQNEIIGVCRKLEAKFGQNALDKKKGNGARSSFGVAGGDDVQETRVVSQAQGPNHTLVLFLLAYPIS
jgi:ATP-dependent RNA helicase DHX37/DHR1